MPLKAILNSLIAGAVSCLFAIGFKYFGIYLIFLTYFSALPIFISGLYFGMTGIFISAIFSVIIMTSVTSFNTEKQLIKITDILGREVNEKRNTPLFYIYKDGTVEKKMIIE